MQVCKTCYKFFQTIYNNKKIKKLKIIPDEQAEKIQCYHLAIIKSWWIVLKHNLFIISYDQ